MNHSFCIATRGSALALAQANLVLDQCRAAFPDRRFELKVLKTTGDKLQTASMAKPAPDLPKGLFTKELEVALLRGEADLAVHSLKDLPTGLPEGLVLSAATRRADVRDVLIARDGAADGSLRRDEGRAFGVELSLLHLPKGACIGTSSTRRQAQIQALRPDLRAEEIRGNVATRLQKLATQPGLDAVILAAAGLERLRMVIEPDGRLRGMSVPEGLRAVFLETSQMLPCVGQAALGIETRAGDERIAPVCQRLNDCDTWHCVVGERAFLNAMGGGCQSPVAALGEIADGRLTLRAVSFAGLGCRRGERRGVPGEAERLGRDLAGELKS